MKLCHVQVNQSKYLLFNRKTFFCSTWNKTHWAFSVCLYRILCTFFQKNFLMKNIVAPLRIPAQGWSASGRELLHHSILCPRKESDLCLDVAPSHSSRGLVEVSCSPPATPSQALGLRWRAGIHLCNNFFVAPPRIEPGSRR